MRSCHVSLMRVEVVMLIAESDDDGFNQLPLHFSLPRERKINPKTNSPGSFRIAVFHRTLLWSLSKQLIHPH
jgi:hypothetical protein